MSGIPADPFGRSRLPATFDRAGRVQLVHECASALLRGELPGIEARLFLASALLSWLEHGGRLERDYLQTASPRGSKATAAVLARRHRDERQDLAAGGTVQAGHEQEPRT